MTRQPFPKVQSSGVEAEDALEDKVGEGGALRRERSAKRDQAHRSSLLQSVRHITQRLVRDRMEGWYGMVEHE